MKTKLFFTLALLIAVTTLFLWRHSSAQKALSAEKPSPVVQKTVTAAPKPNECLSNGPGKEIIVSISQRHLWACAGTTQAYESAVITGMENVPADLTPVGTYHVYGKQTNHTLQGCDPISCWNDFVYYWMPFLNNQYGVYGFHDATWRKAGDFGNISPYSSNASRGCVELPLATAKWLYSWAAPGTTVSIVS